MKTYLKIQFSAEGAAPSDIIKILESLGWKSVVGEYDFVMEQALGEGIGNGYKNMADRLNEKLRGTGARYSFYSFP